MKAQTSQGDLSIRWQYGECDTPVLKGGGEQIVKQQCCSCFISRGTGDAAENVSVGSVKRFHTDSDSKIIARKESFKKAVANFSKADKKALWEVIAEKVKLS